MKKHTLFTLIVTFVFSVQCSLIAQTATAFTGQVWVSTKGYVQAFLNGKEILKVATGVGKSEAVTIKTGDHLVLRLEKTGNGRPAMVIFALSSDETLVCNFRNTDFRIINDVGVTDFTDATFATWKKSAVGISQQLKKQWNLEDPPIKNYSEYVWGDANDCLLGAVITDKMFKKKPR